MATLSKNLLAGIYERLDGAALISIAGAAGAGSRREYNRFNGALGRCTTRTYGGEGAERGHPGEVEGSSLWQVTTSGVSPQQCGWLGDTPCKLQKSKELGED